ncbi:MAG: hypothetical protein MJA82_08725 [Clostridia bacterium]|nr:hypothetical protein [Clostridia bacterium]
MIKVLIECEGKIFKAQFNESNTAKQIIDALPIEGNANIWGDEIYFKIPVEAKLEKGSQQEVEVGELAYWPMGNAFCIFFGRTPVSTSDKPKAYSPVSVFGKLIDLDIDALKSIKNGSKIKVKSMKDK